MMMMRASIMVAVLAVVPSLSVASLPAVDSHGLDDPPVLFPPISGSWTDSQGLRFTLDPYQPFDEPAAPMNSIYKRCTTSDAKDCDKCRLKPEYSYETRRVTKYRVECDDGMSGVFDENDTVRFSQMHQWYRKDPKAPNNSSIHTVHMIYMNHYDVGYTSYINNVDNTYMHEYFKLAADTSEKMRAANSSDSFIYTTHAWLMYRFFNCPCPEERPDSATVIEGIFTDPSNAVRYQISHFGGSLYGARCLTTNWQNGTAGGCGWTQGECTLATDNTLTCKLDGSGGSISGKYENQQISFATPWIKFTGALSGLWYGPSDTQDYTVLTEDSEGNVTVWWDAGMSQPLWTDGFGSANSSAVSLLIPKYSPTPIVGTFNSDNANQITWIGNAGTWNRHDSQCYPKFTECPMFTGCPARTLNNNYSAALQCPSQDELDLFVQAANKGDIVWHAGPFNWQPENMSPALFEAGFDLVKQFDEKFYGSSKQTTTMSVRDVIYVTRSVIPYLNERGITGLTIGSNGADFPPQVPKLHRWVDPVTGSDIVVAYHPYGYGGYGKGDCAESPNGFALCTEFRVDNSGPPSSVSEVQQTLDKVRQEYPGAVVKTSTFDAFIADVLPVKDQLPVITMEVGDTWMYGTASDPLKMAQNRAIQRVWIECLNSGFAECETTNKAIMNMTFFLLKGPEHTWGTPGISGWGGGDDYNISEFRTKIASDPYMRAASSWAEQRFFNELAVRTLEEYAHPLAPKARAALDELVNIGAPDISEYTAASPSETFTVAGASVQIGEDASITSLKDGASVWATAAAPLSKFVYQTFNETEWKPFTYSYINGHSEMGGFSKPGSNNFSESAFWNPTVTKVWVKGSTTDASSIIVEAALPAKASTVYGAPKTIYFNYTFSRDTYSNLIVSIALTTLQKLPVMIGESSMLTFKPAPKLVPNGNNSAWNINKLGYGVDPEGVQNGGNQFNHATMDGATVMTTSGFMELTSYDAANMLPMTSLFPYGNPLPASYNEAQAKAGTGMSTLAKGSVEGMAVNLHNNLWNTNYPLFYPYFDPLFCPQGRPLECKDQNLLYRLMLKFSAPATSEIQ